MSTGGGTSAGGAGSGPGGGGHRAGDRAGRLRIGLLAAACQPGRGSEPGIGWNWVRSLAAAGHDIELFTTADPEHNRSTVAAFAQAGGPGRLRLHPVPAPPRPTPADRLIPPMMREEWQSLQGYFSWLSTVDDLARSGALSDVDVVQHVTLGSLNCGSVLAQLRQPLVFGPVGGGQRCPARLLPLLGASGYGELLRDAGWAGRRRLSRRFRHTMRRADVVFATNRDTARLATGHGARRVELMMCEGVWADSLVAAVPERELTAPVLLWVGSLRPRKAPGLALRAFRHVVEEIPAARLVIIGDGPLWPELQRLRAELGLTGRVTLAGHLPHAQVRASYAGATLLLFTSARDSLGGPAVEAWASALPTVSFGHQGIGDFAPPGGSVRIPVCPAAEAPRRFAAAICAVLADPVGYPRMCAAALAHARRHTLEARAARTAAVYAELLAGRRPAPARYRAGTVAT